MLGDISAPQLEDNRVMAVQPLARALALFAACVLSAQTRDGFIPVSGARLFFRDFGGNGAPVIFLHAASGNSDIWEKQSTAFTAAGYRVITYDRRGWWGFRRS